MVVALDDGSAGLIGAEAVRFLANKGYRVVGIDADRRLDDPTGWLTDDDD